MAASSSDHHSGRKAVPPSDSTAAEREWVAGIQAGDETSFEALFRAYYDPLCRHIVHLLGSRDRAEDVVQGVFARVWQDRARLLVSDIRQYLYAAVRRRALSELRHDTVRRRKAPLLTIETAGRGAAAADAEFEAEELRRRFERALEALPPRTREAFVLSRAEGQSYDQIALRMGISPKTVGVHISKALAALRRAFGIPRPDPPERPT